MSFSSPGPDLRRWELCLSILFPYETTKFSAAYDLNSHWLRSLWFLKIFEHHGLSLLGLKNLYISLVTGKLKPDPHPSARTFYPNLTFQPYLMSYYYSSTPSMPIEYLFTLLLLALCPSCDFLLEVSFSLLLILCLYRKVQSWIQIPFPGKDLFISHQYKLIFFLLFYHCLLFMTMSEHTFYCAFYF